MRVMITGGTGFIGSNLARGLLAEEHEVVAYDLMPTVSRIADIEDKIKIVQGDICNLAMLAAAIKENRISHIMHLAAYLPEAKIREHPTEAIRNNVGGTNNIFDAARITDVERVVYASTDAVNPLGSREDAACRPTTLYGHMKLLNETMGIHYFNHFSLDTIGLRFGMNYGPGGRLMANELERKYASAVVHSVIEKAAAGESVVVPFHESTSFHWVYFEDNVRAMIAALKAEKTTGRVFNTCGTEPHTLGDMAEILRKNLPAITIAFETAEMPPNMKTAEALVMDCSAARRELGYIPEYSLELGLRAYVERYRSSNTN